MGCKTAVRLGVYLVSGLCLTTIIAPGVSDATVDKTDLVAIVPPPALPDSAPARVVPVRLEPAQVGVASWYGFDHQGKLTASGTPFDARKLTAAHPTLPLNSKARVTNLDNGKSVEVTITDRGPGAPGRAIDLSERAAKAIGMKKQGLAPVEIKPVAPQRPVVALE